MPDGTEQRECEKDQKSDRVQGYGKREWML